jgi:chemotaxis response regulator CheB
VLLTLSTTHRPATDLGFLLPPLARLWLTPAFCVASTGMVMAGG